MESKNLLDMNKEEILIQINSQTENTLMKTLGIIFTELGEDYIKAKMPVNSKVHQPFGLLHGGASIALAESLGSCLSNVLLSGTEQVAVGVNINAQHLKSKKEGEVIGIAKMIKKGRKIHFIEIEICDEEGELICYATMSNMILSKSV